MRRSVVCFISAAVCAAMFCVSVLCFRYDVRTHTGDPNIPMITAMAEFAMTAVTTMLGAVLRRFEP